jgi:hypothetical protein
VYKRQNWNDPNYLTNLSLPTLKILKVYFVPVSTTVNLIKSTKNLSEISIHCVDNVNDDNCKLLIQSIYQNCPNIKYLKLSLERNLLITEFENLLISCQSLNGLIINVCKDKVSNWDELFQILTKSSPSSLFKFKFYSPTFKLNDVKLFFDNWKNRRPMLLKIKHSGMQPDPKLINLAEKYKAKGVINRCYFALEGYVYEDFEWSNKKIYVS